MSSANAGSVYITTPIYYVNDAPHVGHCYTTLLADAFARSHKLAGADVFLLTGTDEHAEKVVTSAQSAGLSPESWADRNAAAFRDAFDAMGIGYDDFIRTTEPRHTSRVAEWIASLQAKGDVYLGEYSGWWDASQEEYLTETDARQAGFKSPVSGKSLERRTEQNYFFRLSAYQGALASHIASNPGFIRPESRKNEVLSRIKQGLNDVPISRAIDPADPAGVWGIRMPGDDTHRVYVWIDALFNYLSAVESDGPCKARGFRGWPADAHLIAKDILWFHAVIWPCLLLSLGRALPGCVYAHSYWVREGRKMSKSLGNFIDMPTLHAYASAYGLDALRWYLLAHGPQGSTDADFSHAKFVEVCNADLANGIGNAFSRVSNMIAKYFGGSLPDDGGVDSYGGVSLRSDAESAVAQWHERLGVFDLAGSFGAGIDLTRKVDAFIHQTSPFKLAKDASRLPEVGVILRHCAEALRTSALLLSPAMPASMGDLLGRMGSSVGGLSTAWGSLSPGSSVKKGKALFPRIDAAAPPPVGVPGSAAAASAGGGA